MAAASHADELVTGYWHVPLPISVYAPAMAWTPGTCGGAGGGAGGDGGDGGGAGGAGGGDTYADGGQVIERV